MRQRTGVQYFSLPARSALNRESSRRMPFAWTLNPYRGCEFGCKYCYARYTHEFMELSNGLDIERKICARRGAPELLRVDRLVETAPAPDELVQREPAALGRSLLSGAHLVLVPRVVDLLRASGRDDVLIVVGGIIPEAAIDALEATGVARVFTPGASLAEIGE